MKKKRPKKLVYDKGDILTQEIPNGYATYLICDVFEKFNGCDLFSYKCVCNYGSGNWTEINTALHFKLFFKTNILGSGTRVVLIEKTNSLIKYVTP